MKHRTDSKRFLAVLVAPLSLALLLSVAQVQANQIETVKDATNTTKQASKPRKPRGRLPAYYTKVVNEEQRLKIYSIQAQHMQKIRELRSQLAAALETMNSEVATVLSEEQREKVAVFVKQAAEKRKAKKSPPKTTAAKTGSK